MTQNNSQNHNRKKKKGIIFRLLTNGASFAALSAKYPQGLKNSPYVFDHCSNLENMYLDPRESAQNMRPPLKKVTIVGYINKLAWCDKQVFSF